MHRSLVLVLVGLTSLTLAAPAGATADVGIEGPTFGADVVSRGLEATGQMAESKLFFTQDDRWWAVLGLAHDVEPGVYLLELTEGGWEPRSRLSESDPWSKADTVYDATSSSLLVSLRDNMPGTETNPRRSTLHRLSYDGSGGWTESSAPLTITMAAPETITIAQDSDGRVWAAFEQTKRIRAGYLLPGGTAFTYLKVSQTNVAADDIAAVVAFGEPGSGSIGIVWSDQIEDRFMFAVRSDDAALRVTKFTREVAYGDGVGGCPTTASDLCADDHVHLTAVAGTLLAAVKTNLNDTAAPDPEDPLIVLLTRSATTWSAAEVSDVQEGFTRPIVLAAPGIDTVHVFAHVFGDDTYAWSSSLSSPSFGEPVPWTVSESGADRSNPTSTKQTLTSTSGYVVMTSTPKAPYRYWYGRAVPVVLENV